LISNGIGSWRVLAKHTQCPARLAGKHQESHPEFSRSPAGHAHTKRYSKEDKVSPHQDSRIFVVDEEHISASTLAAILQKSGFSAKFFTCPREALAAARLSSPAHIRCDDAKSSPHRSCDPNEGAISKVQVIAIVGTGMQPLTCSRPVMRADTTSTCY
jgi:hypothetical protein